MTGRFLALTLLGACIGLGLALILDTRLAHDSRPASRQEPNGAGAATARQRRTLRLRRLVVPVAAGVAAWVLTGWPVPGVMTASAAYFLPGLMVSADREHGARQARIDAVASWAELMRDTLSASAGLLESIRATAPFAPEAILPATSRLVEHLGRDPQRALRAFADEVADPIADRVVVALAFAVANPARDLAGLLGTLADAAREQAAMNNRIHIARARTRTTVRMIIGLTLSLGAALALLDRNFLAPYASVFGQLALFVIGALFAGGFAWLGRLSHLPEPPRLLAPTASMPAQRRSFTEHDALDRGALNPRPHRTAAGST